MKLTDALRDLLQTISAIDFETIEVTKEETPDGNRVHFRAMTVDRTLILRSTSKEDIPELPIGKFGISNLGILQGLMNLKMYNTDDTTITYVEDKNNLAFKSSEASTSFVLTAAKYVPAQPRHTEQKFNVTIDPSSAKLSELKSFSSVFKSFSTTVIPYVDKETLFFFVGEDNKNTHSGVISFAKTEESLKRGYGFSTDRIMQCTSRINNAKTKSLSISEMGMMKVQIDTGLLDYSFYIVGQ